VGLHRVRKLQTIKQLRDSKVKGALLQCKRRPFATQKMPFCNVKGRLLECNRCPFKNGLWYFFTYKAS